MDQIDQKKGEESKKNCHPIRNVIIIIGIVILLLLLLVRCGGIGHKSEGDGNVTLGVIDMDNNSSSVDLQELANSIVAENEFQVFINTDIKVSSTNDANLKIQNGEANHYACYVELVEDDSNVVLYESDIIEPGYKIERAKLDEPITSGVHECTAFVHVLDKNGAEVNKIGVAVTISKK